MDLTDFYQRVSERGCCDDVDGIDTEGAVHAVLAALSLRLEPGEAAGLRRALPKELKPQLAHVEHVLDFDQDAFIEDVAARLDIDDDDAEHVALAVLGAVRDCIRPQRSREQVIELLPSDLAHLMHEIP